MVSESFYNLVIVVIKFNFYIDIGHSLKHHHSFISYLINDEGLVSSDQDELLVNFNYLDLICRKHEFYCWLIHDLLKTLLN